LPFCLDGWIHSKICVVFEESSTKKIVGFRAFSKPNFRGISWNQAFRIRADYRNRNLGSAFRIESDKLRNTLVHADKYFGVSRNANDAIKTLLLKYSNSKPICEVPESQIFNLPNKIDQIYERLKQRQQDLQEKIPQLEKVSREGVKIWLKGRNILEYGGVLDGMISHFWVYSHLTSDQDVDDLFNRTEEEWRTNRKEDSEDIPMMFVYVGENSISMGLWVRMTLGYKYKFAIYEKIESSVRVSEEVRGHLEKHVEEIRRVIILKKNVALVYLEMGQNREELLKKIITEEFGYPEVDQCNQGNAGGYSIHYLSLWSSKTVYSRI